VSPRDVADLIGDTGQMVLKHYARWVPERQARLTRILQEALSPKAEPVKLVAISERRGEKLKLIGSGLDSDGVSS
jgi:hypothetical protein